MLKKILRGALYVLKAYLVIVGIAVTVLVAHKLLVTPFNKIPEVRAQLNIKLPPVTFSNKGEKK